jgi:hypothetical protein
MRPAGFETAIPASERPQTQALDHSGTGIGVSVIWHVMFLDKMGMANEILLAGHKRERKIDKDMRIKVFDNRVTPVNTDCNR